MALLSGRIDYRVRIACYHPPRYSPAILVINMDGARGAARADVHSEERLPLARRLDWRFLLPDPELGDVAYIGAGSGALLPALRMFSRSVEVIPAGSGAAGGRRHDVVVVEGPSRADLRKAGEWIRPGGWLYAEIARLASGTRAERWRHPDAYAAAARAGGLTRVSLHCHWRTFETCSRIVPLHDRTAWTFVLSSKATTPGAGAILALARLLRDGGALDRLVPCFSVVAQKPAP